jgi:cell division protein FtsB
MLQSSNKYRLYFDKFTDIRFIGQVVFVVIVLLISWSGVRVIHTNYQLQQQISRLQQENEIQKLQNENQKLKNEYYKSPQYLELAARQNFGLATSGEKELLVPKAVALAHVPAVPDVTTGTTVSAARPTGPFYSRNLQAWFNFYLHRAQGTL